MCGGGCRSLVLGRSASVRSIEDNRIEVTGAGNRPTQVHAFWYRERRDRIMVDVLRTIAYGDRCGADDCVRSAVGAGTGLEGHGDRCTAGVGDIPAAHADCLVAIVLNYSGLSYWAGLAAHGIGRVAVDRRRTYLLRKSGRLPQGTYQEGC